MPAKHPEKEITPEFVAAAVALVVAATILIAKEYLVPLESSSRGLVLGMVKEGSLPTNYALFGVLAKAFVELPFWHQLAEATGNGRVQVAAHALFITSSLAWIGLVVVLLWQGERENLLCAVCLCALLVNPVIIHFDLFAWRQSLSLALFLIGTASRSRISTVIWVGAAVLVHPGLAPVVGFYVLASSLKPEHSWTIIAAAVLVMLVAYQLYPFPNLPAWFPFRLQLSNQEMLALADPSFNNIGGKLVPKYFATIVISAAAVYAVTNGANTRLSAVAIALSLPLVAANFVPGANRLVYYSIVAACVYLPICLRSVLVSRGYSQLWALALTLLFHAGAFLTVQS